jgi:nitroreductase
MNSGEKQKNTDMLSHLIVGRRTRKPKNFKGAPSPNQVTKLIDIARHAPNHHRTQPARFYLLDSDKIKQVARLFGQVVQGDKSSPALVERGKKKEEEWSLAPGLLIVTCHTDKDSELVKLNPDVIEENYATCCCICQNLLLLFEAQRIASKWSTGKVWEHPEFANCVGITKPSMERVVALLFYGYSDDKIPNRSLANLSEHLRDYNSA